MARIYKGLIGQTGETVVTAVDSTFNHLVVGCTYYTDDTFSTIATPTAGTISIEGQVSGNSGWSSLDLSSLDCTDDSAYASTSIPLSSIRGVCSDLDAGIYFSLTVTANDH